MSSSSQKNSDSPWPKWLISLASPVAVGIYITLTLTVTAFFYYLRRDDIKRAGPLLQVIHDADQISLDYRLKLRGVRPVSDSVAVLAIDDRSIDIIGRWPWPRDVMGRAIEKTFEAGAKVIAADIVWSEPSDRPEVRLVQSLTERGRLSQDLTTTIKKDLEDTDPDSLFATGLEKYKSKFILGSFFSDSTVWQDAPVNSGYRNACHDLIFRGRELHAIHDAQATPPVVIDSAETIIPDEFSEGYFDTFAQIESRIRSSRPRPKTPFERYLLENDILAEKIAFCSGHFLHLEKDETAQRISQHWNTIKELVQGLNFNSFQEWAADFKGRNILNAIPETLFWTTNISELNSKGENFGYFNAVLDHDGTIRRSQLIARTGSKYFPSIALQAYLVATGQNIEAHIGPHPKEPGLKSLQKMLVSNSDGETVFSIPVSSDGLMLINYAGPGKTVPHASLADLLNENDPNVQVTQKIYIPEYGWQDQTNAVPKKDFFKDKVLVLGATAVGVYDLRVTPFDENFPGVETHANVIDNLVRRDFLARSANEDLYMPLFLLVMGVFTAVSLSHFGALSGLIFTIGLVTLIALIDRFFLFTKGHLVSIVLPLFQVSFTYIFLTFYKYLTEERSKKELRATFSKYVSPAIVEEILQDPKNLELGGRKERVTVFFSDVRGFTTISEKLDPRALSDLLNSYLTPMTELVFKNQGTLDKYMGDAIMAFFGAPVPYPNHAKMACRCALQSLEKLKELQNQYAKKNLPMIDIGIGLNTGECSVGNMGSETVRSYTVMGDAVNLASRLEGINKSYGTRIIISEFTYEDVKNEFLCREVDWVRVKGKLKPVKIYELMAEGRPQDKLLTQSQIFSSGYEKYHARQFDEAIRLFNQTLEVNPEDETSKIYVSRCQEFLAEPPSEDWDGVYVMKTK